VRRPLCEVASDCPSAIAGGLAKKAGEAHSPSTSRDSRELRRDRVELPEISLGRSRKEADQALVVGLAELATG